MTWKKPTPINGEIIHFKQVSQKAMKEGKETWNLIRSPTKINDKPIYFSDSILHYSVTVCRIDNISPYHVVLKHTPLPIQSTTPQKQSSILPVDDNTPASKFIWSAIQNKLIMQDDNGSPVTVCNFHFKVVQHIVEKYSDRSDRKLVQLTIFTHKKTVDIKIETNKYSSNVVKEIMKFCPQCVIDNSKLFAQYAAKVYDTAPETNETIYYFSGWHKVQSDFKYFNSAMTNVITDTKLQFDNNAAKDFIKYYWQISNAHDKLVICLIYSMYAYMSIFFEEAGIDGCRSLLYLSAPTGTGKTTLAKILCGALLDDKKKAVLRFDDTLASLEESLFKSRDALVCVDDFYAKGNKMEDQEFKAKASTIARIIGDAKIKGKMGANRKPLPDRNYRGGIVATGEFVDLNTHSTYLRCWILYFLKETILFNDALSNLQKKPELARCFFSSWINWLEKEQKTVVQDIKRIYDDNLSVIQARYKKAMPRFTATAAGLLTVAHFANEFLSGKCIKVNNLTKAILNETDLQMKLLVDMSPVQIVLKAVSEAIDNAYLRISDTDKLFVGESSDGYFTDDYIFIITSRLESIIEKYADKNHYGIRFNTTLKKELVDSGIMLMANDKYAARYSKIRSVDPKRPRLYIIKRSVLHD